MSKIEFVTIPNFSRYLINSNGLMIIIKNSKAKVWSITKDDKKSGRRGGYKYCQCVDDLGITRIIYQHRVLAELFLTVPENSKGLTVNHKDGNKSNNKLNNLEWCTYQQNNQHAWDTGLHDRPEKHILVKYLVTGKIIKFKSLKECSHYFGDVRAFYYTKRVTTLGDGKLWADLLEFKMNDDTPWPITKVTGVDSIPPTDNPLIARNVFTGELTTFTNAKQGESEFSIPAEVILDHARNNKRLPYKGFNFRYMAFFKSFPQFTDRHLLCFKEQPVCPGGGVIMQDTVTYQETFFPSFKSCCSKMEIHNDHLRTIMYSGRLFKKRYSFKLFEVREVVRSVE